MRSPWQRRPRREVIGQRLGLLRWRWSGLTRGARLNVALYIVTVVSMLALVFELLSGAPTGRSTVSSATPTSVANGSSGPGTTLRDRRPGTTVIPSLPTTTSTTTSTTLPPPVPVTRAPARRPATTVAPAPTTPPTTAAPPETTAPPTTRTTVDPNPGGGPVTPEPPVLPFPDPKVSS